MDLIKFVEDKIDENLSLDNDNAFYILDIEDVQNKYRTWIEKIPRVIPYYAVKCNNDERVLRTLAEMGAGFDCASLKEIKQILDLNVDANKIVYTHPAKQISQLKYSAVKNVEKVTFDSAAELEKIKKYFPTAKVVLRIRFDSANAILNLGLKFGCDPQEEALYLIKMCKDLKMNLIGISFHVGSGTSDYGIFERALEKVRELFDYAKTLEMNLNFVDIGGGFIGTDLSYFDNYAKSINAGVDKYFANKSIEIISEPGRYFVDSAFKVIAQVVLKRNGVDGQIHYYLNEGIFMSFLISSLHEEEHLNFSVIKKSNKKNNDKELISTVWGCSCSSKDKIIGDRMIAEMEIGDWMVFHNMGAYTNVLSTQFNGFQNNDIILVE